MWITRDYYIISPRFTATLISPKLQCGIDVEKTLPHYIALTTKYPQKFKTAWLKEKLLPCCIVRLVGKYKYCN